MPAGRLPLPLNLVGLKGISGRNSAAAKAGGAGDRGIPNLPVVIPDAPSELSPKGQEVFNDIVLRLAEMRVMTNADIPAVVMYADAYVIYDEAMQVIRDKGAFNDGVPRPQVRVASDAHKICLRLLSELGMTPSARVRVRANG